MLMIFKRAGLMFSGFVVAGTMIVAPSVSAVGSAESVTNGKNGNAQSCPTQTKIAGTYKYSDNLPQTATIVLNPDHTGSQPGTETQFTWVTCGDTVALEDFNPGGTHEVFVGAITQTAQKIQLSGKAFLSGTVYTWKATSKA
jgi:hypothetical protein